MIVPEKKAVIVDKLKSCSQDRNNIKKVPLGFKYLRPSQDGHTLSIGLDAMGFHRPFCTMGSPLMTCDVFDHMRSQRSLFHHQYQ